jgi:alanine racemase
MDGYVGLRGKHYPIAGRVCMDQFMVDFRGADVRVGDEVLIFGQNNTDTIHVEDIAQAIDSTSYVLLTAIGGRTERIFIN